MKEKRSKKIALMAVTMFVAILSGFGFYEANQDKPTEEIVQNAIEEVKEQISTYEMSKEEIDNLASTEIKEQTEEQEKEVAKEQEVESEGFELQGEIAYEGDRARTWNVELGDYKGLTYYSQIDSRWSSKMYSSVNNPSQTIGSSGCGPTSAAMVVTACKGAITPDKMSDLFVRYGYRSANNGTYFSAFRAVADEFDIGYQETFRLDDAVNLLRNNHYLVVSCANGLFTTGGHFIVLTGINGDTISVYDPYLYSGKFETSTRRGKASVNGNTVYVTIDNFRNYANYQKFFAYKHDGNVTVNSIQTVTTANYTRYVKANGGLNVRNAPNGARIGGLANTTQVTVAETSGNWSRITNPVSGWVSSNYLVSYSDRPTQIQNTAGMTKRLSRASVLYSNSNLTGIKYNYKANTTITILQNVSANVDRVRINATGRVAYINNSNYTNVGISQSKSTPIGQYKRLKARTTLYGNSNLTGTRYSYLPLTQVKVVRHVSSNVDYVYVVKTGRYAYVNTNSYK